MVARKNFSTGQIINALRKAEVGIAKGIIRVTRSRQWVQLMTPIRHIPADSAPVLSRCLSFCGADLLAPPDIVTVGWGVDTLNTHRAC